MVRIWCGRVHVDVYSMSTGLWAAQIGVRPRPKAGGVLSVWWMRCSFSVFLAAVPPPCLQSITSIVAWDRVHSFCSVPFRPIPLHVIVDGTRLMCEATDGSLLFPLFFIDSQHVINTFGKFRLGKLQWDDCNVDNLAGG